VKLPQSVKMTGISGGIHLVQYVRNTRDLVLNNKRYGQHANCVTEVKHSRTRTFS
jgi:hypothetical protein